MKKAFELPELVNPEEWVVTVMPVGPLACNCTLIGHLPTGDALIIDPGGDANVLLDWLTTYKFTLKQIVHTHGHFDHILAADELREATGATVWLEEGDRFLWDGLIRQCQFFGCAVPEKGLRPPDGILTHGQTLACHGTALLTPGHTPGSTCFHFPELTFVEGQPGLGESQLLVAGDTLFRRGVGRTDLWGGDSAAMQRSIQQTLYTLKTEAVVVTGHGPLTSLEAERRFNPYIRAVDG